MKFKSAVSTAVALAGLVMAAPASADIITYTFGGTVTPNKSDPPIDAAGLFGGGDLSGDALTLVIMLDTSVGIESDNPTYDVIRSGSLFGTPVDLSAALTVNGHVYTNTVPYSHTQAAGELAFGTFSYFSALSYNDAYQGGGNPGTGVGAIQQFNLTAYSSAVPLSFDTPFSFIPDFGSTGGFGYNITDCTGNPCVAEPSTNFQFTLTSAVATDAATPVPEPLTLSLFGAGLAGAIAARRRRKPNTVSGELS